jgi:flagellum-specific peptidoglycan hydrolase FlgJ
MKSLNTLALGLALWVALPAASQGLSRSAYIDRYKDIAIAHAEKYGIPASIKMAQGILESGYGNGSLAVRGNTHFNIKVKASDNWRGEVVYQDDDRPNEPFRAYATPEDSWIDHSEYLNTQPRYDSLFDFSATDYRSWARGLKNAGYATDPLYTQKLLKVIEDNRLWELDAPAAAFAAAGGAGGAGDRPGGRGDSDPSSQAFRGGVASGLIDPDRYVAVVTRRERHNRR